MFKSKPHHLDKDLSKSWQELLDTRFYYGKLVPSSAALLYTVSSVPPAEFPLNFTELCKY